MMADMDTSLFDAIEARQPPDVIRAIVEERPHLVRARPARRDGRRDGPAFGPRW